MIPAARPGADPLQTGPGGTPNASGSRPFSHAWATPAPFTATRTAPPLACAQPHPGPVRPRRSRSKHPSSPFPRSDPRPHPRRPVAPIRHRSPRTRTASAPSPVLFPTQRRLIVRAQCVKLVTPGRTPRHLSLAASPTAPRSTAHGRRPDAAHPRPFSHAAHRIREFWTTQAPLPPPVLFPTQHPGTGVASVPYGALFREHLNQSQPCARTSPDQ